MLEYWKDENYMVEKEKFAYTAYLLLDDVYIDGEGVDGKLNAYLPLSFYSFSILRSAFSICANTLVSASVS